MVIQCIYRNMKLQRMRLRSAGIIVGAGKERIRVAWVQFTNPNFTPPPPKLRMYLPLTPLTNLEHIKVTK